ncbi:glycosyltransferase family 2 protein [Reyranella sp.]|uniref:glycosyltransferase family 2 protein n=1 Tax=Reyranella sp. TaxID=1929291 RepID=UPI003D0DA365
MSGKDMSGPAMTMALRGSSPLSAMSATTTMGVDVFIPCYNYGHFLEQCVDSILSQDGVQVRVLIIDDASTDGSLEEARRLAARDSRVSVFAHPVNKGHTATYNDGIAWASAPYMVLVSADDLLAPLALSRSIALMEARPEVGFVYGALCHVDGSVNGEAAMAQARAADPCGSVTTGRDFIASLCRRPICLVPASGVIVRTTLQQRLGGYLPELPHSGDLEMWLRLAAHADVGILGAPTAITRIHASNMRHEYHVDRLIPDYQQRALAFRRFFERQAEHVPGAGDLARSAMRRLAEEVVVASDCWFDQGMEADAAGLAAVALEIDPTVVRTKRWWRTAAKRTVGWKLCQSYGRAKAVLRGTVIAPRHGGIL